MKLFDTLSGMKREFSPLRGNTVRIYTCGPSVYAYSHIGNFRTYLFEDVLVRYLAYKGYKVKRVMNITDVEDKAIAAARKEGLTLEALQKDKIKSFFSDWDSLGMARPDVVAKASEHVPEMVSLIRRICARGYCKEDSHCISFDVRKFPGYGKLRHLKNARYLGTAHSDDYAKEGLWDFRLWKKWTPGDGGVKWKSPFGYGRPGWHIECSAMAMHYLGESFDIHCGGSDNIFPHHENEIAQSEASTGKPLANFWLHARHLTIGKKKMSKSTGNVLYVRELLERGVEPSQLRLYLISERYRSHLDFTPEEFRRQVHSFNLARTAFYEISRLARAGPTERRHGLREHAMAKRLLRGFEGAMDNDLNTRLALRRTFRILRAAGKLAHSGRLTRSGAMEIVAAMGRIDSVLGIFQETGRHINNKSVR